MVPADGSLSKAQKDSFGFAPTPYVTYVFNDWPARDWVQRPLDAPLQTRGSRASPHCIDISTHEQRVGTPS